MRKRLLAAALVLCMALAMLPVGASAAEKSITDFIKLSANMDEQPVPKRTYNVRSWWQEEVRKTLTEDEITELANKYGIPNESDWLRNAFLIFENGSCVGYYQAVKKDSQYVQEYMYYMPEELELTFETISDGKQGVEALEGYIDISAYSDPDGDGIYDQRAAVGYGNRDKLDKPVPTSETGPLMGEINRGESGSISTVWYTEELYDMSGNLIWKYTPACERSLGMYYIKPKTVITGAEMKELFGPDTIVEIEVCVGDIYGGSTTSAFYSFYIPGENTKPNTPGNAGGSSRPSISGGSGTSTETKPEPQPETKPTVSFADVEAGSWYESAVAFAVDKGLFKGVDENHFAPDTTTNRAMVMTVLARLDGQKADTYDEAVQWAISKGVSDGSDINAVITREQFVTMLYRYAGQPQTKGQLTGFADVDEVSDWASHAMTWAVENGIVKGNEKSELSPLSGATRAEAAAIMQRYIELIEK